MTTVKELREMLEFYDEDTEVFFEAEGYTGGGDKIYCPVYLKDKYDDLEGLTIQFDEN